MLIDELKKYKETLQSRSIMYEQVDSIDCNLIGDSITLEQIKRSENTEEVAAKIFDLFRKAIDLFVNAGIPIDYISFSTDAGIFVKKDAYWQGMCNCQGDKEKIDDLFANYVNKKYAPVSFSLSMDTGSDDFDLFSLYYDEKLPSEIEELLDEAVFGIVDIEELIEIFQKEGFKIQFPDYEDAEYISNYPQVYSADDYFHKIQSNFYGDAKSDSEKNFFEVTADFRENSIGARK